MKNKYNLSRYIDDEIKIKIRQNSKFACVVPNCRNSFYTYEHLLPEFKDCKIHDPEKICLACSNHNPRRTGKNGQENYSKNQLIQYYENLKKNDIVPKIKNNDFFYGFKNNPTIEIGKSVFKNIKSIINIDGFNVFSFQQNKDKSIFSPEITFSGVFNDEHGELLFQIIENEWSSPTHHWDIQTTNGEIKIWDKNKNLVFGAQKIPDKNTIKITELNLWFKPFHIKIEKEELYVGRYTENMKSFIYLIVNSTFEHGNCGVFLSSKNIPKNKVEYSSFKLVGGKGAMLTDNGIWLGRGVGIMRTTKVNIIKSSDVPTVFYITKPKTEIPTPNGNYFVTGKLVTKKITFPMWTENEYYLNNQKLDNKPVSWGMINNEGDELFYIDKNQTEDFALNTGFIGFYADDVLKQSFADKVFTAMVKEVDLQGNEYTMMVKRFEIGDREIISEFDPIYNKNYVPNVFAGVSPWKPI
jgi:hypothetical protein